MIISHSKKFIFFAAGKTGSTAIERVLAPYADPYELSEEEYAIYSKHMPPLVLKDRVDGAIWDNYFKFAFARNPWDWMVSQCFYNRIGNRGRKGKGILRKISEKDIRFFLGNVKSRGLTKNRTQWDFLSDREGNLLVDYVGKVENIEEDMKFICEKLGLEQRPLTRVNKTVHRHYKYYHTKETVNLVAFLFRKDIESFGYSYQEPHKVQFALEEFIVFGQNTRFLLIEMRTRIKTFLHKIKQHVFERLQYQWHEGVSWKK